MGPALRADDAGAFDHGADRMQRMTIAPGRMGLGHGASLSAGLEQQAALQRIDRLAEMQRGHHLGLRDPERLADEVGEIGRRVHGVLTKIDGI